MKNYTHSFLYDYFNNIKYEQCNNPKLILNEDLNIVLLEYYNYLLNNNPFNRESLDYLYAIVDILGLINKYVEKIEFIDLKMGNGSYIPENKYIGLCLEEEYYKINNLNDKKKFILDYLFIIFHEINHAIQEKNREEYRNTLDGEIMFLAKILKYKSTSKIIKYHDLYPDESDSNISSISLLYNFFNNNKLLNKDSIHYKNIINKVLLSGSENNKYYQNNKISIIYYLLYKKDFYLELFPNLTNKQLFTYGFNLKEDLVYNINQSIKNNELNEQTKLLLKR